MNAKKVGLNIVDGRPIAILEYMGIRHGLVEITGVVTGKGEPPQYMYYTRHGINRIVGFAAVEHGLDIIEDGVPFIREFARGLPADIADIAMRVRDRKLDVPDMGGLQFELKEGGLNGCRGHFMGQYGQTGRCIRSFKDALYQMIEYRGIPVPVAIALLKQVLVADLPIETPKQADDDEPDIIAFIRRA